jgi:hypothetical protein
LVDLVHRAARPLAVGEVELLARLEDGAAGDGHDSAVRRLQVEVDLHDPGRGRVELLELEEGSEVVPADVEAVCDPAPLASDRVLPDAVVDREGLLLAELLADAGGPVAVDADEEPAGVLPQLDERASLERFSGLKSGLNAPR